MKKVLVLGASYLQTFIIKKIREMGLYCIAVDGNPNSVGFQYADKYYTCSTTEKEKVLKIAVEENIDGILTYASDVAAPTVAYVAEYMELNTNPYRAVQIMTDKAATRKFMTENGFNVPKNAQVMTLDEAIEAVEEIGCPVIFKPTDSAGSKGVSRVNCAEDITNAFEYALDNSRSKRVIVEKYLIRKGYQIDADCFMHDGELVHFLPMDQHRDMMAPYSPIGISAPSILDEEKASIAFREVERFLKLLNMKFGEYNVEYIFDENDDLYILEIGPRAGGNLIPDVILESAGIDLREYIVRESIGMDCSDFKTKEYNRCISSYIIHSQKDGAFKGIIYDERVNVLFENVFVETGEKINKFTCGGDAIGFSLIEFPNLDVMSEIMDNTSKYIQVLVE